MVTITIFVTGRTITAGAAATDTLAVTPGRLSPDVVDGGNEHRRPGYGGTAIIDGATAGHVSKPRVQPKATRRLDEPAGNERGGAGAKRRRMPRVASALVPTPVSKASAGVIDEAVAGLDAIAPAEVEQHPPSVGTARRALREAQARE